jgi:integrase
MQRADERLKKGIALGAIGTLREGEVCALLYGDVDYSRNMIHVHADMVQNTAGEWVIKPSPKTVTSNRLIPLPAEVMALIGSGDPGKRIVDTNPSALGHAFARLRDSLGLKCRFHDLRHYAASIMHAIGVPDVYIMERGGWKTDNVLKTIYRNSLSDQSAKFAERANEHFSGLF